MIRLSSTCNEDHSFETPLEFTARLWLRTAVAAWLLWLGPLAVAVMAGVVR
jgi:hypothetical protein